MYTMLLIRSLHFFKSLLFLLILKFIPVMSYRFLLWTKTPWVVRRVGNFVKARFCPAKWYKFHKLESRDFLLQR